VSDASLAFDHVHLVSADPHAAAGWYADKLGGKVVRSFDTRGAPQIYVAIAGVTVIVRGQRTAERAAAKQGLQWGVDHFGLRVDGDFEGFCAGLRSKGVTFSLEPKEIDPDTRIAFIDAPDGVSVELLHRKAPPP